MEKAGRKLTLVVEKDLLFAARKVARDQGTSVNRLIRRYLATLVEEHRRHARARLKEAMEKGLVTVGDRTLSRADLYG
jgi:hypothetical protein